MTQEGTGRCWEASVLSVSPSPGDESFVRVFSNIALPLTSALRANSKINMSGSWDPCNTVWTKRVGF